jgi:hypothetical protein
MRERVAITGTEPTLRFTHPLDLPCSAPQVVDSHRGAVLRAEASLSLSDRGPNLALDSAVELLERLGARVGSRGREGGRARATFEGGGVVLEGSSWPAAAVVHAAAHAAVHPAFPLHGIEFVQAFVAALGAELGPSAAEAHAVAFEDAGVHSTPSIRSWRVRRAVTGAIWKERGVLARVVCDDPPEDLVCQLLELRGEEILVRTAECVRAIPLERCRYFACAHSEARVR